MIGSLSASDAPTGLGSIAAEAHGRAGGGEFASALQRAFSGDRGGAFRVDSESDIEPEGELGDRLWQKRVEEQREKQEDPGRLRRAQEGAEQLVAATFIVPILQQLRESNTAAAPFGPGMYEKRLGPMLDHHIADRIVSAQRLPIVEAVRDGMLGVRQTRLKAEVTGEES
ncbi:MAG: hypothetical protein ACNA8P_01995 [Phycisphaerales bacterium]